MKKLSSFVLAALLFVGTFFCITPNAFAQTTSNTVTIALALRTTATPADSKVIIFKDGDFQGASQQLGVGSYDIKDLTFGNDQLSSLKVPSGYKVTLYEHGGFQGKSKSFTSDAGWVGDDFNDIASSVKIEPSILSITEPEGTVKLNPAAEIKTGRPHCMPGSQLFPLGHTAISPDLSPGFPKS